MPGIDHEHVAGGHGVDGGHLKFVRLVGNGIDRFRFGGEHAASHLARGCHGADVGAESLVPVPEAIEHIGHHGRVQRFQHVKGIAHGRNCRVAGGCGKGFCLPE